MSFWRKEHDTKTGIIVYYCDKHDFHSSNGLENVEHEKILHSVMDGASRYNF